MRGGVFLGGASDDFVVDIGVIAHEEDVVAGMSEESAQDVKDDEGAGMSDMGQVIDGEAAHIDGDFGWVERNKIDLVASGRIIETNGNHGISFINDGTSEKRRGNRTESSYILAKPLKKGLNFVIRVQAASRN